jgi:SAM-dependent methyltransferase
MTAMRDFPLLEMFESELRTARTETRPWDREPPRVLDAGCGWGRELAWMRSRGWDAAGVDLSQQNVEEARRHGLPVEQKDIRLLTLPKEALDGVFCHRTLSHLTLEETQRVLASFFQSLRPGSGLLFVSWIRMAAPAAENSVEDAPKSDSWLEPTDPAGPPGPMTRLHAFSESAFLSLLRQSGFTVRTRAERRENERDWVALVARRTG